MRTDLRPGRSIRSAGDEIRLGTTRTAGYIGCLELIAEMGCDPAKVLARSRLSLEMFQDGENRIPFTSICRLLKFAAEETACPHFGLLLAQRQKALAALGPIGFMMLNSTTVGDALHGLCRYLNLMVRAISNKLLVHGEQAALTFDIYDTPGKEEFQDHSMATLFMIMRTICGQEWLPGEVRFAHQRPADIEPYHSLFRAPVSFAQEVTATLFPASVVRQRVAGGDSRTRHLMRSYAARLEQQSLGDFSEQIRRVVRTTLPTGKCTAGNVAELFSMHRRTLHRRLAQAATSFADIVSEVRYETASQALAESAIPIGQLAAMLGYGDTCAFTRAFHRCSGVAPSQWRAQHRIGRQ